MYESTPNLAVDYPLMNVFWTMMMIFLWVLWFMLLFRVFGDIFRDDDLGGWGKAGWTVFVIILPFLGVFVYLIARGRGMGERDLRRARASEEEPAPTCGRAPEPPVSRRSSPGSLSSGTAATSRLPSSSRPRPRSSRPKAGVREYSRGNRRTRCTPPPASADRAGSVPAFVLG